MPSGPNDKQLFDLARLLWEIYGSDYAKRPTIRHLAEMNCIATDGYVDGPKSLTFLSQLSIRSDGLSN